VTARRPISGLSRFAAIPTAERVHGDPSLSGAGVVMAFADVGFRAHPDLATPKGRVLDYFDATGETTGLPKADGAGDATTHGVRTVVVAAGSGDLEDGRYRGLAYGARLVLINVGLNGRVKDDDLARGIRRATALRASLGVRVLNVSVGGDLDVASDRSDVVKAVEEAVAAGIVVVVAAGNAGCSDAPRVAPPASAPSALTVGGLDDGERLDRPATAYCSSFGPSLDGIVKPEVVAPAAHVAAPLVPGTEEWRVADALAALDATPDYLLSAAATARGADLGLPSTLDLRDVDAIRAACAAIARERRLAGRRYGRVDGTSFAAPIVSSIVAQLLELDPTLTPIDVKRLLMATARRVENVATRRQGYGAVDARRALNLAREGGAKRLTARHFETPVVRGGKIRFNVHDRDAADVRVAGPFNDWNAATTPLLRDDAGVFVGVVETGAAARAPYKFVVDGAWRDDPSNPRFEDDGRGGRNSVAEVAP
jgi:serine protease AprX